MASAIDDTAELLTMEPSSPGGAQAEPAREAQGDPPEVAADDEALDTHGTVRLLLAALFPVLAAALMVGGIFTGAGARVYAAFGGVAGLVLAAAVARSRKPLAANALALGGILAIGLLTLLPSGVGNVFDLGRVVGEARAAGDVLRPPVPLSPGWQALLGWLMGLLGFAVGWLAIVLRKPAMALLLPMPVAGIAGISVPEAAQVPSGIAVLVLFALGLGLLGSHSAEDGEGTPSLAFEVRRMLKALPLIAAITAALVALSQANFLFPPPKIDPTREPQKPQTVPLSEVEDRVLFEVESSITGPWRIGSLDVYDGKDWRLPPFADSRLDEVPRTGVVDDELKPGVRATFTVRGLGGAVLPALPNPVGIIARGPRLAYDARNANIRATEGSVEPGLSYTVVAAALPTVQELRESTTAPPPALQPFTEIPDAPPAVSALIQQAPRTSKWDTWNFLRLHVLEQVTVTGAGVPASVTPERVQDMLSGSREATPFEIVAAQAMLARWVGIPSRIGYGFDGGDEVDGRLQIRPRHGATFPEVWFPGHKWLPIIGVPKKARASVGSEGEQRFDPSIRPSDEISVQLFLPLVVPPPSPFARQVRNALVVGLPTLTLLVLAYVAFPALRKAIVRNRRRRAAVAAGPRARIALAYTEWRDTATDYGYRHPTDTPLMFCDRFVEDEEHEQFAWLVTRALWGDLDSEVSDDLALMAEELSRALRRRLAQAHPVSLRVVAELSRLSLQHPYAGADEHASRPRRPRLRRRPAQEESAHALATTSA